MPFSASPTPPRKSIWPCGLAPALLAGAVFLPVLGFDFVRWDDDISITQNPLLTAPWSWNLVGEIFTGNQALRFKPLHWLFQRGLHAAFGFNPAAWHAFSLGLHVGATLLFGLVLRQILRLRVPAGERNGGEWFAGLGAALWALHPLRAEAVAWATAATYPLTAVALLASFACYLQARASPDPTHRWLKWAWLFAVAAYGSYPVSITYGLWLIAVDCWLLPAGPDDKGLWAVGWHRAWIAKHLCFLAPAAIAVGLTLWSRFMLPGVFTTAPTVGEVGLVLRGAMALATIACLGWRFVWPVELTPNLPPLRLSGADQLPVMILALLTLLGLLAAWRERRRKPAATLVWLGFVALALPCLGLTERPGWPVDRYSYIAHLVLIGGATVWLFRRAQPRSWRMGLGIGAAAVLAACAWGTRAQLMIWRNSTALFTHMERHPDFAASPRQQGHVYILWARYEATAGRPTTAAELFNRAQHTYLAAIQAAVARQDYPEALALSTHLANNFPLTPVMRRERGAWLLRLGRRPEALGELQLAQMSLPDDPRVKLLLAEARR